MPRMFGTDGVRGLANRDLTAQLALDLGDAAVRVLGDDERSEFESRRRALVGRDTRVSGDFLAAALSAGMSAGGFDVIDAGIIPTPGVAYLTSVLTVEMGGLRVVLAEEVERVHKRVLIAEESPHTAPFVVVDG